MHAQDADHPAEGRIGDHIVGHGLRDEQRRISHPPGPFGHLRSLVGRDDPGAGEPGGVQRRAQVHEPGLLVSGAQVVLVPAADVADGQAVSPSAPEPVDDVAHVRTAPQAPARVADPGRSRPLQAVQLDRGIARQGLAG